ncbi:hypothetical protein ES708_17717 [subsurface metagenome]
MENIIVVILKALGALGEKGIHYVLELIETKVVASSTEIDNIVFYEVLDAVKTYESKNPID